MIARARAGGVFTREGNRRGRKTRQWLSTRAIKSAILKKAETKRMGRQLANGRPMTQRRLDVPRSERGARCPSEDVMRRPQYDDCCGVDGAVLVDYELQGHHALNIRLRQDQRVRERCVLRRSDRLIDLACKECRRSPRTGPNRVGAATRRPGLECRHRQISRSATQDREEETRRRSVQDPTDRRSPVHRSAQRQS